ncbi:YT521-B-like domain-containing protein [Cercophora newfieldiana]|uniref:YT521-B-like domain-containing protein n=1 Tax=Cercophora newfieldiana TaxID=92897 RepID=A0AA39YNW7_9PEZI|nr:YT521-B-like domain-containing protein [Cercophora newfieldiana]
MGDTPHPPGAPTEFGQQGIPAGAFEASSTVALGEVMVEGQSPFQPAYLHHPGSPQHAAAFSSQLNMTRGQPFDMNAMANALPQAPPAGYNRPGPYGQGQGQARYNAIAMSSPVSPYQPTIAPVPGQQYYLAQQHGHMGHFYPTPMPPQQPSANLSPRADLAYYQNAVMVNQQPHGAAQYYYPQSLHYPSQGPTQPMMTHYAAAPSPQQQIDLRQQGHPAPLQAGGQTGGGASPADPGRPESEGRPSVVRGPPRKPRQSGHAIWIGNLPPQTDLMSLVHHVCKEADGLESLFLISKSNCAFANFKDEPASIAAQRKLHDSKFQTVRLVSRLRKSTVEGPAGVTAPTGPAASTAQPDAPSETVVSTGEAEPEEDGARNRDTVTTASGHGEPATTSLPAADGTPASKDRFFILKSLTIEDIELSARTGIWATQSHNEETLNKAFKSADNVYLIFSANKSGEYFGYARMVSPIIDDPDAAIEFAPKVQPTSDVDLPRAIPTDATEFAPKGRIIDDSARGTIFWEAERDDQATTGDEDGSGGGSVSGGDTGSVKSGHEQEGAGGGGEPKAWGKPFRLEWLSTARLPFYRTRGLRNPWNSNREVKIARDGTELEPSVGRRLIGLFNRAQSPALGVHVVPGLVPSMVSGVPYVYP